MGHRGSTDIALAIAQPMNSRHTQGSILGITALLC